MFTFTRYIPCLIALGFGLAVARQGALAQNATPKERVDQIADAASLVKAGGTPWHLRMSFQLFDLDAKPAETGTIEEWWVAPNVYRLVVSSPGYSLTIPSGGDSNNNSQRAAHLVRLLIDQVVDPVPHYGEFKGLEVTEVKHKFGKAELSCYDVLRAEGSKLPPQSGGYPEFCVDPGMSDLRIHFDSGNFAAVRNHIGKFRGVQLGLDNAISYSGKLAITGHVEVLESYDPAKSPVEMTHPRENTQTIPGLVLAGRILKKESPIYPELAKERHLSGSVILAAIITKDGTISSLDVIASPDPILSSSATAAVKHWTYQPYLLNGQPTEVDTTITVNYNLSPAGMSRF